MAYCKNSKREDKYCPASNNATKCASFTCPEDGKPFEGKSINPTHIQKLNPTR